MVTVPLVPCVTAAMFSGLPFGSLSFARTLTVTGSVWYVVAVSSTATGGRLLLGVHAGPVGSCACSGVIASRASTLAAIGRNVAIGRSNAVWFLAITCAPLVRS